MGARMTEDRAEEMQVRNSEAPGETDRTRSDESAMNPSSEPPTIADASPRMKALSVGYRSE